MCVQSSSDVPLLVTLRDQGRRLLSSLVHNPESDYTSRSPATATSSTFLNAAPTSDGPLLDDDSFRIGFITPPFRDNKIPVTNHLHAHAYVLPTDLMGWWRGVAYSGIAWYAIDDLIAEIRYVVYSYLPPFASPSGMVRSPAECRNRSTLYLRAPKQCAICTPPVSLPYISPRVAMARAPSVPERS